MEADYSKLSDIYEIKYDGPTVRLEYKDKDIVIARWTSLPPKRENMIIENQVAWEIFMNQAKDLTDSHPIIHTFNLN